MNINEVHWNFSDNGTKEPAKSWFWNFYNFWTAWNFLMRFSLLCSGEWALSFCMCVFIYIGVSLITLEIHNYTHYWLFLLYNLRPPFCYISGGLKGSFSHGAVFMMIYWPKLPTHHLICVNDIFASQYFGMTLDWVHERYWKRQHPSSHWSMFTSDCQWQRRLAIRYNIGFLEQNGCTH